MRISLCALLALILIVFATPAQADEVILVSWTNATQNEDGSSFDATAEQREIRISCFNVLEPVDALYVSAGDAESVSIDFPVGNNLCSATTVNNNGVESGPSNFHTFTVDPPVGPTPLPPSGFGVPFGPLGSKD